MAVQSTQNSPARTHDDTLNKPFDSVGVQALEMKNTNGTPSESRPTDSNVQHRVEPLNEQLNIESHNSVRNQPQQQPDYADESPELLRWRADNLLDEMMLGAVDISAGDSSDGEGHGGESNFADTDFAPNRPLKTDAAEMNPPPVQHDPQYDAEASEVHPTRSAGTGSERAGADIWQETAWLAGSDDIQERDAWTPRPLDPEGRGPENARPENTGPTALQQRPSSSERFTNQALRDHAPDGGEFDTYHIHEPEHTIPAPPAAPLHRETSSPPQEGDARAVDPVPVDNQSVESYRNGNGYLKEQPGSASGGAVNEPKPEQPDSHRGNGTQSPAANGAFTPSFVAAPFPTGGAVNSPAARPEPSARPAGAQQAPEPRDENASFLHPPAAVESQLRQPAAAASNGTPEGTPAATGAAQPGQPANPAPSPAEQHPAQRPDQILNEYINNQTYQREQERKQWAIMSGRSNDYPASIPRSTAYPDSAAAYPYGVPAQPYGGEAAPDAQNQAAYDQQGMSFADAMAVGPQARRRMNVLPRQSMPDMDALREEIFLLQEQVETALPLGRDTAERARHLVEKAHSILGFGVERAAEVSYYIQQVRAILQRVEQRLHWSNIYRRRLQTYLTGWLLLSVVLLLSALLYAEQLQMLAANIFAVSPTSLLPRHIAPFLFAFAAGAAGSSAAALVNMWRHAQKDYGFFDRKYGMLGIVLPIIGVLVGSLLFIVISGLYALFGLYAAGGWSFGAVPAVLAFVFGCVQEHIYGTSD